MYFVFLNASKIDSVSSLELAQHYPQVDNEYFQFIRKICPYRTDTIITLDRLLYKFKTHFNLPLEDAKQVLRIFIDQDLLQIGYNDEVNLNILANHTRKEIYSIIQEFPGIYISMIRNELELGSHQTLWHLGFLLEFNYITETKFGKIKAYSEPDIYRGRVLIGFILFKNSIRNLLETIAEFPKGISIEKLQSLSNRPRSSLHYTLKKLLKLKVIEKTGEIKNLYKLKFELSPIFQEIIAKYYRKFHFETDLSL